MATVDGLPPDPLSLLRASVAANQPPLLTTSADATAASDITQSLAEATHLAFNLQDQHISVPLTQPTRLFSGSGNKSVDFRTVYLYHVNRNKPAQEYISLITNLNDELSKLGKSETVSNLLFQERVALQSWLDGEGGEEGNEFIRSVDNNRATRAEARDAAAVAQGGGDVEMRDVGLSEAAARKKEEERLKTIYSLERKMGDRNTVLRGFKVQDFSNLRKLSAEFLSKARPAPTQAAAQVAAPAIRPAIKPASNNKRVEPIILLSPSASSLIRMSNAKTFLQEGLYSPPEPGATSNLLQLTRMLPNIDDKRAIRFILVDSPDSFRPDYWSRVVAVFTTGQSWQFKNYKWQTPAELFSHVLGVYVGWKGDSLPDTVRGWGRGVVSLGLDKGTARWRDREVVEEVWVNIEARMKAMGWNRDGPRV